MADLSRKQMCIRRLAGMMDARKPYEADAREIASYTMPARSRFLSTDANKGKRTSNRRMNSSHGIFALRTLQGGMTSGLSSGSRPWFALSIHDEQLSEDPEVKQWLAEVEKRMYAFIASTNFYSAVKTGYLEMGAFGTEACVMLEHPDEGAVCHQLTFGEYWIAVDSSLTPSALYRKPQLTALQAMQMFGKEGCGERVMADYDAGRYDKMHGFVHAIEINEDYVEGKLGPAGKKWSSLYWEENCNDKDKFARIDGYNEQPFWSPRWDTTGGDFWGQGPGHDALPDLRELQMQAKRKAEATDLHVWPEKIVGTKTKLKNLPRNIVSSADADISKSVYIPYEMPYQTIGVIREDITECKQAIDQATYADLFMAITNMNGIQPRNVEEIASRNEEKLTQLGPVIERVNNEKLEVAIERVFGIMERGRMLPPAPESMRNAGQLKISFVSVLTVLQRMVGLGQIERGMQFVGSISGMFPGARHKIDYNAAIDEYWDRAGAPAKLLRSTEEAQADADAEAQAAQAQQVAETAAKMGPVSDAMTNAGQLASQAPVTPAVESLLPVVPR